MTFHLGRKSIERLSGVHPDLVRVASLGIEYSPHDFTITEGLRSIERQRELVAKGFSKTFQSKHLIQPDGFAHAFDLAVVGDLNKDGALDQQDKALEWKPELYTAVSVAMLRAATELGIAIRWGGSFKNFFDGPHYELVAAVPSRVAAGGLPLKA